MMLETVVVAPGAEGEMEVTCVLQRFHPLYLVIPERVGAYLHVTRVMQGSRLLVWDHGRGAGMDGVLFRETLAKEHRVPLPFEQMLMMEKVSVRIKNVGFHPLAVTGHLGGLGLS